MYPEACHDYWGGKPLYPIHKPIQISFNIHFPIHFLLKMDGNSVKHLKFAWNAWECVCMCGIALLKAKTFKAFAIYFSVYLLG